MVREAVTTPGPGDALAPEVAAPLGHGLGVDLSPVRVHTDSLSAAATAELGVRAFTWGVHVYLAKGEHPTDLPLLAHEVTHAVQQSGGPAIHLFDGPHGELEHEAHRSAAAVVRGGQAVVLGRTSGAGVQGLFDWARRGLRAVGGAIASAASAVVDVGAAIRDRVMRFIKDHARSIPGYDLLGFILGRDPITQQPVERNAINLIRGILGLIPGGAAVFENLQKANVIQRAYDWFSAEITKLNITWPYIRGLFSQAWDALSITDLASPSGAWEKLKNIFGPPLARIGAFAIAAGRKVLEFVFEGALALAGSAGQQLLAIFRRIGAVFSLIVSHPLQFLGNLVNAVKGGFQQFKANIVQHLKAGIFEWLMGEMRGMVQLPTVWDFAGIVSLILQILGLTYSALREILVRIIGEPAVKFLEGAFEFLRIIVTKGLSAAWEKIKEFAAGLVDTVIAGIRDWVVTKIVTAAVTKLATMFNPVGAIIQGIITIYNTVMFFIERAKQIARLVNAILDSIENIARGNIGSAIAFVEKTMASTLAVIISFLARLIGLGNVTEAIREIIGKIRATIANALEKAGLWIKDKVKGLLAGRKATAESSTGEQQASRSLLARLAGTHTRPQVEEAARAVFAEVRLRGVERLEVGPESGEGEIEIRIAASPLKKLFRLIKGAVRRSMRMAVRVVLQGPSPARQPLGGVLSQEEFTPGRSPEAFRYFKRPDFRQPEILPEKMRGGAVFVPAPGEKVIRVVAWNTSDADQNRSANPSHAERHFTNWFESLEESERLRVIAIEVHNVPYSPCNACGPQLGELLQNLNVLQGRRSNDPGPIVATLTWEKAYVSGSRSTYQHTLDDMAKVGWRIDPATLPAEPEGYEITK